MHRDEQANNVQGRAGQQSAKSNEGQEGQEGQTDEKEGAQHLDLPLFDTVLHSLGKAAAVERKKNSAMRVVD